MTRQSAWLKAPQFGDVTQDFPACIIPNECYRAHDAAWPPGWFASVSSWTSPLGGRFDLISTAEDETDDADDPDDSGGGTLYCANDVEAALRERLGPAFAGRRFIAASDLHDTRVSIIHPLASGYGNCLADTFAATGILTREISTMPDYEVTRAWAAAFYETGFDGLAYEPRSTPGKDRVAFAVFGPAGADASLAWEPHPTWWQEMVDLGVILARISGDRATIIPDE